MPTTRSKGGFKPFPYDKVRKAKGDKFYLPPLEEGEVYRFKPVSFDGMMRNGEITRYELYGYAASTPVKLTIWTEKAEELAEKGIVDLNPLKEFEGEDGEIWKVQCAVASFKPVQVKVVDLQKAWFEFGVNEEELDEQTANLTEHVREAIKDSKATEESSPTLPVLDGLAFVASVFKLCMDNAQDAMACVEEPSEEGLRLTAQVLYRYLEDNRLLDPEDGKFPSLVDHTEPPF